MMALLTRLWDALKRVFGSKPPSTSTPPRKSGDPWSNDNERKARINEDAAARGEGGWIPRRPDWLRRRR
jgi:hypothetical protein